jgi:hypothetical protein
MRRTLLLSIWLLELLGDFPSSVVACGDREHHHHRHGAVSHLRRADLQNKHVDDHRHLSVQSRNDEAIDPNRFLQDGIVEECGTRGPTEAERQKDEENMRLWKESQGKERSYAVYKIDVHFHVISDTQGGVTDERIADYMDYLNDSFKNSSAPFIFEFKSATQTINSKWANDCYSSDIESAMKGSLRRGKAETLNIYICNRITTSSGQSLAGYSYKPFNDKSTMDNFVEDGVVLARSDSDRRLNTCVHEVVRVCP